MKATAPEFIDILALDRPLDVDRSAHPTCRWFNGEDLHQADFKAPVYAEENADGCLIVNDDHGAAIAASVVLPGPVVHVDRGFWYPLPANVYATRFGAVDRRSAEYRLVADSLIHQQRNADEARIHLTFVHRDDCSEQNADVRAHYRHVGQIRVATTDKMFEFHVDVDDRYWEFERRF